MNLIELTGPFAIPLCLCTSAVLGLSWFALRTPNQSNLRRLTSCSLLSFLVGLLGALVGTREVFLTIQNAEADTIGMLMAGGIQVALVSTIWGTSVTVIGMSAGVFAGISMPQIQIDLFPGERKSA